MSTTNFKDLETVDEATQLLIFGFIRYHQTRLSPNLIIPDSIIMLCLLYYYLTIIELELPPTTTVRYPHPQYYYSKQEQKGYIILAPGGKDSSQIYRYDFVANKWEAFVNYPDNAAPRCSILSIDQKNDILYLTHGLHPLLIILDINTKKWTVHGRRNDPNYNEYRDDKMLKGDGRGVVLENGEFHLLITRKCENEHVYYDPFKHLFKSISKSAINNHGHLGGINMVYIKGKQIMIQLGGYLGGYTDKIWFTEKIKKGKNLSDKVNYIWKEFPLTLPELGSVQTAVAFDMVLIAYFHEKESRILYILDFGDVDYKWIEYELETDTNRARMVITRGNDIHFINANKLCRTHFKIHLSKVLPIRMYMKYASMS